MHEIRGFVPVLTIQIFVLTLQTLQLRQEGHGTGVPLEYNHQPGPNVTPPTWGPGTGQYDIDNPVFINIDRQFRSR